MTPDDTIAAIASAPGGAYRGIVRISGPDTVACLSKCFRTAPGVSLDQIHRPRVPVVQAARLHPTTRGSHAQVRRPRVLRGEVWLAALERPLPCDLFLWPSSRSYTREPTAEIHTIGSPPLLTAALETVCRAGARLAAPGEFTMRAFLAGRLDLTQAEAVLGVIDARDREQLDVALTQLAGGLAGPLGQLRLELLELLAHLEAGLDFVDEDIEFISQARLLSQLDHATAAVVRLKQRMATRDAEVGEPRVVLMGRPNVGKSSLLNALAENQAALVAGQPGTTRDYLTCRLDFGSLSCVVVDTAGVIEPETEDAVATAAQAKTSEQNRQADVRILCLDATRPPDQWEQDQLLRGRSAGAHQGHENADSPAAADKSAASPPSHHENPSPARRSRQTEPGPEDSIVVITKCDLDSGHDTAVHHLPSAIRTSSKTLEGFGALRSEIRRRAELSAQPETNVVAGTAARCRDSLRLAEESLIRAREAAAGDMGDELVAADVRAALTELGKVVGAVYTDDVLDRIFSRFCIGK